VCVELECGIISFALFTHVYYICTYDYIYVYIHIYLCMIIYIYTYTFVNIYMYMYMRACIYLHVQPIADKVAQNLEIISKTFNIVSGIPEF